MFDFSHEKDENNQMNNELLIKISWSPGYD